MNNLPVALQNTNIISLNDIIQAANIVAKSGLFGVKNAEEAATLMFVAQAEGSHFMTALREFHVIDKKPSIKADAALSRFQKSGGTVRWLTRSDTVCEATFAHPQGGELTVKWTYEQAEKAGFTWSYEKHWDDSKGKMVYKYDNGEKIKQTKDNWLQTPRQMLAARVVSEGVRAVFPACIMGFYTPEEVIDFNEVKSDPPAVVSPPPPAKAPASQKAQEAEVIPPAAPPAQQPPGPDYNLNLGGRPAAHPNPPAALTSEETASLCEWLKSLPDKNRYMKVVEKYCRPSKIGTLSKQQAKQLINELVTLFGLTYNPIIFKEDI
jgi:hypothetical protein